MKKRSIFIISLIFTFTIFSGCSAKRDTSASAYNTITSKEAKDMMDQDDTITILDVRTEEEFISGHIKGALLIPDTEIKDKAEKALPDKSTTILVYCRSGRRSALTAANLAELGYTNVYDFGGIIDWEYDIDTN